RRGSTLYTLLGLYLTGTLGFFGWALQTETLRADLPLLIAGIVIGLGSAAGNLLFMKALDQGPASLTSPLVNTNILLIILFSVIVYGERLSGTETRSEEHTSELQSRENLVCRLLLEKKKM